MKRLWKVLRFVLLALLLAGVWAFRPLSSPRPSDLDPRIRTLSPPFTVLEYDWYLDGGSVMLRFKDSTGKEAAVSFKVLNNDRNDTWSLGIFFHPERMYPKAYWGDLASAYKNPVELENGDATRSWAARLLYDYAERSGYSSHVVFCLTGRWRFIGEMIYYNRIKGRIK